MSNWLTQFDQEEPSAEEHLEKSLSELTEEALESLGAEFGVLHQETLLDEMTTKIAGAYKIGKELANEHGDSLRKEALLGSLAMGLGKGLAGGAVKSGVGSMTNAANAGGFSYKMANQQKTALLAGIGNMMKGPGSVGQKLLGGAIRNPGKALMGAGAVGGALMAPRDPQTGEKHYLQGAMMGAAVGGGAHLMGAGNALRKGILSKTSPMLGQGVRQNAISSLAATGSNARRAMQAEGAASKAVSSVKPVAAQNAVAPAQNTVKNQMYGMVQKPKGYADAGGESAFGNLIQQHNPDLYNRLAQKQVVNNTPTAVGGAMGSSTANMGAPVGAATAPARKMMPKLANGLIYDPATKTFLQAHQLEKKLKI